MEYVDPVQTNTYAVTHTHTHTYTHTYTESCHSWAGLFRSVEDQLSLKVSWELEVFIKPWPHKYTMILAVYPKKVWPSKHLLVQLWELSRHVPLTSCSVLEIIRCSVTPFFWKGRRDGGLVAPPPSFSQITPCILSPKACTKSIGLMVLTVIWQSRVHTANQTCDLST